MRWRWQTHGSSISMDWSFWSGRKRLAVDQATVELPKGAFSTRLTRPIELGDGASAVLAFRIRWLFLGEASMSVDGQPIAPVEAPEDLPWWVWVFVAASAAIMVVTKGGALWGALAGVGAASCVGVSRINRPPAARLLGCAAIVAACWGVLAAVWYGVV